MLPARPNALVTAWFDGWCRRALRRHFAHVYLYPESPDAWRDFDPGVPRIYVANHSSFWDGIVVNHLVRRHRRQPLYCMIDAAQVREHPFFRRVGGFSVDRARPRDGLRAIEYAAGLLNGSPAAAAVLIFPQGAIRPNDARPLRFEPGVARLIALAPRARVVPLALRYEFWLDQRAEAMLALGRERQYAAGADALAELERDVTALLDDLKGRGLSHEPGPHVLLRGKRSISRWKDAFRTARRGVS